MWLHSAIRFYSSICLGVSIADAVQLEREQLMKVYRPPVHHMNNYHQQNNLGDPSLRILCNKVLQTYKTPETNIEMSDFVRLMMEFDKWSLSRSRSGTPPIIGIPVDSDGESTIVFFGDLHGDSLSFGKLLQGTFQTFGDLNANKKLKLIFLGDVLDRGSNAVHVVSVILSLKLSFPAQVFWGRGNHEDIGMNEKGGFANEIADRYFSGNVALGIGFLRDTFYSKVLPWLPYIHIIGGKIFAAHGGIPLTHAKNPFPFPDYSQPAAVPLKLTSQSCPTGVEKYLMKTELITFCRRSLNTPLWRDVAETEDQLTSKRGLAFDNFNYEETQKFLEEHRLKFIVRGHEHKLGKMNSRCLENAGDNKDWANGESLNGLVKTVISTDFKFLNSKSAEPSCIMACVGVATFKPTQGSPYFEQFCLQ